MRYVQINSFYSGSTGTLMRRTHERLRAEGHDSYMFWGRRGPTLSHNEIRFATSVSVTSHGIRSRFSDRAGFYSAQDTRKLIVRLQAIQPDVIHLHNLHGYYLNIELLFSYLKESKIDVKWTLHDCWAFTGHCSHFEYVGCERWQTGCFACPQKAEYPKSILIDASQSNYRDKRRIFTSLPTTQLSLVTPSEWLASLVRSSFLQNYPVTVIRNEIDRNIFRPTQSRFRENYSLGEKTIVLGVASPWTPRKGLQDFMELSNLLPPSCTIVLVGLTKAQIRALPSNVVGLERTESAHQLAGIYSSADVFFNPTYEDTFPTVNLEAEACGTPVITYASGGSPETIHDPSSLSVPTGDVKSALSALKRFMRKSESAG